jgi:hypothetical protein
MRVIVIALVVAAIWIHISPQAVFFSRAVDYGNERCADFTLHFEWSWWSLRFHNIYPKCIQYR